MQYLSTSVTFELATAVVTRKLVKYALIGFCNTHTEIHGKYHRRGVLTCGKEEFHGRVAPW